MRRKRRPPPWRLVTLVTGGRRFFLPKKSGAAAFQRRGAAFFDQVLGNHPALFEGDTDHAGASVAVLEQIEGDFPVGKRSQHFPPAQAVLYPYLVLFVAFRRGN